MLRAYAADMPDAPAPTMQTRLGCVGLDMGGSMMLVREGSCPWLHAERALLSGGRAAGVVRRQRDDPRPARVIAATTRSPWGTRAIAQRGHVFASPQTRTRSRQRIAGVTGLYGHPHGVSGSRVYRYIKHLAPAAPAMPTASYPTACPASLPAPLPIAPRGPDTVYHARTSAPALEISRTGTPHLSP